jgi:MoaA/NifB/PqqE/SkfB family radical SAM enzyme
MIEPQSILLEASSFCQLRCPSCPTTSGAIDPAVGRGFLRFTDFKNLVDNSPSIRRVELSNYGEAFLNPELLQILRYADQAGIFVTIDNGANLNHVDDSVLEGLVKYKLRILRCSIDGATPETYGKYRVRGDFDRVIANIRRINHFKQIHQSEFPRLGWQFIIFGYNEHELPLARKLADSLGMTFHPKLTWDTQFSPIRDAERVRAETGLNFTTRAEYREVTGEIFLNSICHQLWDSPQINWDGKILGCCRNFWGEFGGNAFKDGLSASINSEALDYAREMLRGQRPERDDIPCVSCEIYRWMKEHSRWLERPGNSSAVEEAS